MFPRNMLFPNCIFYKPYHCLLISCKIPLNQLYFCTISSSSSHHPKSKLEQYQPHISSSLTPSLFLNDFLKHRRYDKHKDVDCVCIKEYENDADIICKDWFSSKSYYSPPQVLQRRSIDNGCLTISKRQPLKSIFTQFDQNDIEKFNKLCTPPISALKTANYFVDSSVDNEKDKLRENSCRKENWNDLPNEHQLDEMMYYFQDQSTKLFSRKGWSYLKCSYKVVFENRLVGTKTETLNSYILQINLMKNITKAVLYNPELSILRMTKQTSDGSIHVRWQVQGIPRYIKPLAMIGLVDEQESTRYIDGFSVFYMKNDGLYHRHILMKMTPMKKEEFRTVFSQIFSNIMYKPALRPSLETNIPSNDNPLK